LNSEDHDREPKTLPGGGMGGMGGGYGGGMDME